MTILLSHIGQCISQCAYEWKYSTLPQNKLHSPSIFKRCYKLGTFARLFHLLRISTNSAVDCRTHWQAISNVELVKYLEAFAAFWRYLQCVCTVRRDLCECIITVVSVTNALPMACQRTCSGSMLANIVKNLELACAIDYECLPMIRNTYQGLWMRVFFQVPRRISCKCVANTYLVKLFKYERHSPRRGVKII